MELGMIGLGRMGGAMTERLLAHGHRCVVHARNPEKRAAFVAKGARVAEDLAALVAALAAPRTVWLMVPADAVPGVLQELTGLLAAGDLVVDGGNSHYRDSVQRSGQLTAHGIDFIDAGVSGGVWGSRRGYCLMVGGSSSAVARLTPVLRDLAPGRGELAPTPGLMSASSAPDGYLHCGPCGCGHFVKMVHNGIEYGLMAAYTEGFNLLHEAAKTSDGGDFAFDLPAIAELWRRGSVVGSWLLDLAAQTLARDADLADFSTAVADSGEGRWTVQAGLDAAVPLPVIGAALNARFASRERDAFANRLLSGLRFEFGAHPDSRADG